MTQREQILRYMRDFGSITAKDAFDDLGCERLASRIGELRKNGIGISTTMETKPNRYGKPVTYARYRLED